MKMEGEMDVIIKPWTADDLDQVQDLWRRGLSASQIGRVMGRSRSSILGKIHRMQISARETPPHMLKAEPKRAPDRRAPGMIQDVQRARLAMLQNAPSVDMLPDERPGYCTLLTLTRRTCRWPIDIDGARYFCGQSVGDPMTTSYCDVHTDAATSDAYKRATCRGR